VIPTAILAGAIWAGQAAEIDRLVAQLGSARFVEREAASKRLKAIGRAAFDALDEAATNSTDAEVRRRAEILLKPNMSQGAITRAIDQLMAEVRRETFISNRPKIVWGWRNLPSGALVEQLELNERGEQIVGFGRRFHPF
jgi:hypothetical protein